MSENLIVQDLTIRNRSQLLCEALSFSVPPGRVLTLMGPSGSGKSTILSFISGALGRDFQATARLFFGDREITGLPMEKRKIGILFQDDLLFPHMTVMENLLFAMPRGPGDERRKNAARSLSEVGLSGFEHRYPDALSGGQKARISLMRTLHALPSAILLDEPFAKLDKPLRKSFRDLVYRKIRKLNIPGILVTHDQDDVPEGGDIIALAGGM